MVLLAIQHSLYAVVDSAQIGRFDLRHVSSFVFGEVDDILERVTPLVGNNLCRNSHFFHLLADNAERVDLSRFLSHIHRAFDAQVKRFCYFCQLAHITGNGFEIVIEDNTQCSVNVYVDNRIVAVERLQFQDSLPEPPDIRFDFFSLQSHFGLYVVEKRMRQDVGSFHNHFIGIEVTVVSRL